MCLFLSFLFYCLSVLAKYICYWDLWLCELRFSRIAKALLWWMIDIKELRELILAIKLEFIVTFMDWELKKSDWDLTELGQEDLVGSSSLGAHKNGGGFSVELKLGGLGDLGDGSVGKLKEPSGSTISSPSSGTSKRSKSISRTQNISCFVDGCTNDLTDCRDYYRRHRVCERHSKTPVVVVGGKEKRFCQQCSRYELGILILDLKLFLLCLIFYQQFILL